MTAASDARRKASHAYEYVADAQGLADNIAELTSAPLRDLVKIVRANLTTAEAVAALRVLEHRITTPDILNYAEYLRSDRWKVKRAAKLELQSACESCGSREALHVHHLTYTNVGNEPLDELSVLCRECHAKEHGKA